MNKISKKILGIITARGGSKSIQRKNIKELAGKPLIVYTIEAAKASGVFDRLICSTDDEEIASIARRCGCEVPFMRPKELATDVTQHLPVIQHAVSLLKEREGYNPDYVMILQPTSPLRQAFHIKEAAELIMKSNADSVLSVSEISENFNPHKAMVLGGNGTLHLFNGNPIKKRTPRRQDLQKTYWSIGSIYLFKKELLFGEEPSFYGENVLPYIVDKKYVVDINEPEDWEIAERMALRIRAFD